MIVINSNMLPGDSPRLNLVTSSRDYLATVDYPLRPTVYRTWGKPHRPRSKWHCCYFPQSFPVYRMQRMISMVLCLLVMVLLSVIAFVLVQVVPPQQIFKNRSGPPGDVIENGVASDEDYRKRESGLGLVRTARKLEDHAEYKRSLDENYSEGDEDDYADDEEDDELILNSYGDNGYDDEQDYNPVFDMKYFDFSRKAKENEINDGEANVLDKNKEEDSLNRFSTPNIRQKWENLPNVNTIVNDFKMDVIEDGVVFSQSVEALLRERELSDVRIGQIQEHLRSGEVTVLQEPTWEKCGRPKNQWLEMSSGEAACARYRYPDDYLLVGEVLSFYLSRVLSVGHVPPVVLSQPTGTRWQHVQNEMQRAGWGEAPVVVLTPWLPALVRDHMPSILLNAVMRNATLSAIAEDQGRTAVQAPNIKASKQPVVRDLKEHKGFLKEEREKEDAHTSSRQKGVDESGNVVGLHNIKELSERDLTKLLQWSDLLVFDYLTGNYDRVAYMQDAAEKEGRLRVLSGTIHNLVRSKTTDVLWLLDNESGLIDAYTLLYGTADRVQSNRFHLFHRQMLESMCIFRRSTMEAVLGLKNHPKPHTFLVDFVRRHEPLFHLLPDPLQNELFVKHFPIRVKEVYDWISTCINKVQEHSRTR